MLRFEWDRRKQPPSKARVTFFRLICFLDRCVEFADENVRKCGQASTLSRTVASRFLSATANAALGR
jgi:hypothetical protein